MSTALFERLGRWTWDRLKEGEKLSVRQGEVTLTESLLLEIRVRSPRHARVFKVPVSWEPVTGSDFDLFVKFRDNQWARFVVQAKRLNAAGSRYDSLGHSVGGRPQIELLRTFSLATGAYPLYSLYNYLEISKPLLYWHCSKKLDRRLFGWTVTPASVVASALSQHGCRNFSFIHKHQASVPIRCLFEYGHVYKALGFPIEGDPDSEDESNAKRASTANAPRLLESPPRWLAMAEELGELSEPPPEYLEVEPTARPSHVVVVDSTGTR